MPLHELTVGLRGTRDYVQGSQMLARMAEILLAEAEPPSVLVSAKFTRITDRGVLLATDEADEVDAEELGRAQVEGPGGRRVIRFLDAGGPEAPRIDDVPKSTGDLAPDGAGGGTCRFAIAGTFESYLAAVIECVKALHAGRAEHVSDIWFTALAGARLPLAGGYPAEGGLAIDARLARIVDGRLQTLSVVATEGPGAPPPFQLAFSCLIGE